MPRPLSTACGGTTSTRRTSAPSCSTSLWSSSSPSAPCNSSTVSSAVTFPSTPSFPASAPPSASLFSRRACASRPTRRTRTTLAAFLTSVHLRTTSSEASSCISSASTSSTRYPPQCSFSRHQRKHEKYSVRMYKSQNKQFCILTYGYRRSICKC